VIRLGEAAMLHACTLGRKIGLVATSPAFVQDCEDQIARHGLERRVVAVRALDPRPGQFNRAFDDEGEYRSVRDEFVACAGPMLALGVDVIIPAGGYPMLLGVPRRVPVRAARYGSAIAAVSRASAVV
jgi:allantoin racemase